MDAGLLDEWPPMICIWEYHGTEVSENFPPVRSRSRMAVP